jgi:hypothetical protein
MVAAALGVRIQNVDVGDHRDHHGDRQDDDSYAGGDDDEGDETKKVLALLAVFRRAMIPQVHGYHPLRHWRLVIPYLWTLTGETVIDAGTVQGVYALPPDAGPDWIAPTPFPFHWPPPPKIPRPGDDPTGS